MIIKNKPQKTNHLNLIRTILHSPFENVTTLLISLIFFTLWVRIKNLLFSFLKELFPCAKKPNLKPPQGVTGTWNIWRSWCYQDTNNSLWRTTKNLMNAVICKPPLKNSNEDWMKRNFKKGNTFAQYIKTIFIPNMNLTLKTYQI